MLTLADRGVRWITVHDFMAGSGRWAAAWSLQHAVLVPGHASRAAAAVGAMLDEAGFDTISSDPWVDQMTALVVATRR